MRVRALMYAQKAHAHTCAWLKPSQRGLEPFHPLSRPLVGPPPVACTLCQHPTSGPGQCRLSRFRTRPTAYPGPRGDLSDRRPPSSLGRASRCACMHVFARSLSREVAASRTDTCASLSSLCACVVRAMRVCVSCLLVPDVVILVGQ